MRVSSEGPVKITKATIDATWKRRQANSRLFVRDKDCRGLALIVNATTMVWCYAYRPRGLDPRTGRRWPNRTLTLGNPATLSPDDARAAANRLKGEAAAGADPAVAKKARMAEAQKQRAATLGKLLLDYASALPKRPKMRGTGLPSEKYVAEELAQVRAAVAAMKADDRPVASLTDADLRKLLKATAEKAATARLRFGAMSRFLDWCQDEGHIKLNPCALIARSRRPKTPQARSHYLPTTALARLWKGADRLNDRVWRDVVRFLIAVPCRRGEATSLDWTHLDLDVCEWKQPGCLTKNGDAHRVHLPPLAIEVLKARREAQGAPRSGLVFPAPRSGGEIDTFTRIKGRLIETTRDEGGEAIKDWRWHDFRRSFASALGEAGISESVADAVLNHRQSATRSGVLGVYQRSSRWPEQVKAMQLWGQLLKEALDGSEPGAKVIPILRAG
jgi:integrase